MGFPAMLWQSRGIAELLLNPWDILGHTGVYTVHLLATAVLGSAPGNEAKHCPPLANRVLHHKRSPTVTQAGVTSALKEPGAEHVVCDVVAAGARRVARSALLLGYHRQPDVLQEVRGDAPIRWKHRRRGGVDGGDAPASNHAQRVWQGGERGFLQRYGGMEKGSGCVLYSVTMDISELHISLLILGNTENYSSVTTQSTASYLAQHALFSTLDCNTKLRAGGKHPTSCSHDNTKDPTERMRDPEPFHYKFLDYF